MEIANVQVFQDSRPLKVTIKESCSEDKFSKYLSIHSGESWEYPNIVIHFRSESDLLDFVTNVNKARDSYLRANGDCDE
jgi:hypothetical protein